jgi:hypothetical protein
MHKTNSIIMRAPRIRAFETAADLSLWPRILPHYRYIHYLARGRQSNVVIMAAWRGWIPISWRSEQVVDRDQVEVRFHHLSAFTKGMDVVWTFQEMPEGVKVEIVHDLQCRTPVIGGIMESIIGNFFVHPVASETLRCMKEYLESASPFTEQPTI